jgi:nucleotide-binding universal stress UspA family protein
MNLKSDASLHCLIDYLNSKLSNDNRKEITIVGKKGTGPVVETISELVAENSVWVVIMGNHVDKSIPFMFFDSNVPSVMNYCGCPVLLVP